MDYYLTVNTATPYENVANSVIKPLPVQLFLNGYETLLKEYLILPKQSS